MIYPKKLTKGDEIRILCPSGALDERILVAARNELCARGYKATFAAHAVGKCGRFSATDAERLADLQEAMDDENVRAIICGRGGYGATRIVDRLSFEKFKENPKFVVGFSDITALHAAIQTKANVVSVHGAMAKSLAVAGKERDELGLELTEEDIENHITSANAMMNVLTGKKRYIEYTSDNGKNALPEDIIHSNIYGGNLSLIYALRGTPMDITQKRGVLFIEDIGERMYSVDRMLQNMRMGGVFGRIKALLVGEFTDMDADDSFGSLEDMILKATNGYHLPVIFGLKSGHDTLNMPLVMGGNVTINGGNVKIRIS